MRAIRHGSAGDVERSDTATGRRVLRWLAGQAALVALAALIYFGVRGLTQGAFATAVRNGERILEIEDTLGIQWEWGLQDALLGHSWAVTAANWVYIYGHWPVLIATLVWLALRHPARYITLRNAMFISGAIGIVIFILLPTAPPRLLDVGLIDTVSERSSSYRALQPPGLINKYAAMPSLHFGWNMLVGLAIITLVRSWVVRVLAATLVVAMAFAVVVTANHYVLDVIVGGAVALVGLWLVQPVGQVFARFRREAAQ